MYQSIHLVANKSHVFHIGDERTLIRISFQPIQSDAKICGYTSDVKIWGNGE